MDEPLPGQPGARDDRSLLQHFSTILTSQACTLSRPLAPLKGIGLVPRPKGVPLVTWPQAPAVSSLSPQQLRSSEPVFLVAAALSLSLEQDETGSCRERP